MVSYFGINGVNPNHLIAFDIIGLFIKLINDNDIYLCL